MQYLKRFIKAEYIILAVIMLTAVFLRSYRHEKFLNFQLDQARDAIIVRDFVNYGIEKMPLLGPQIKGGELQLGPAFYYIQAIPAFFFGASPNVLAFPDLIFSILFVPLLYYFLRLYFSKNISLAVSAISATSLFLVIYGRFAWNPNSLPFFTLLAIWGLLKANWQGKIEPKWFYAAIASMAIATQLHFIFFFIAPAFTIIYLAVWKPKLKLKHYLIGILIVLAIYSPIIISNIEHQGENYKALLKTIEEKIITEDKHNLLDKTFHAYQEIQKNYWGIITSDEHGESFSLSKKFYPVCDRGCRNEFIFVAIQSLLLIFSVLLSIYAYCCENNKERKKFIFSVLLWSGLTFLIFLLISYDMSERYYLMAIVPLLAMLGIVFDKLSKIFKKNGKIIVILIASVLILSNLKNDFVYLKEHKDMAEKEMENVRGRSFFDEKKITLEQLEMAANYIEKRKSPSKKTRVAADNTYARSIYYLLQYQKNISSCYVKWSGFHPFGYYDYFIVLRLGVNEEVPEDLYDLFDVKDYKKIGNLLVIDARGKKTGQGFEVEEPCYIF